MNDLKKVLIWGPLLIFWSLPGAVLAILNIPDPKFVDALFKKGKCIL